MAGPRRIEAVAIINRCIDRGITDRDSIISAIRSEMYSTFDDPDRVARDCYRLTLEEFPHLIKSGLKPKPDNEKQLQGLNSSYESGANRAAEAMEPRPKSTSFTLGQHFAEFIDSQVATGRYGSASEVVRAAMRLLEETEAKREALGAALIEGEQSGPSTEFDLEAFLARKRRAKTAA